VKLRNLLLLGAGVLLGLKLAEKLREDDAAVLHGPRRRRDDRPALRVVSVQVQRLTDAATDRGVEAIRRVRSQIRDRLAAADDVAAWN
jgi:hypothetical protein